MLIQLEGNEASGKTTLLKKLEVLLSNHGYCSTVTHLPSSQTKFGIISHDILNHSTAYLTKLHSANEPTVSRELVLTLTAYLDQYIYNSKLSPDKIYLQSRGILSNLVYSDLSSTSLSDSLTQYILPLITLLPKPDLIVYLRVPSEELVRRLGKRGGKTTIYDKTELLHRINTRYERVLNLFPSWNILTVDNTQDIEVVVDNILTKILELITYNHANRK